MSIDDGHKRGPARDPDHDSLRAIQQETTRARRRGASCALHRPLLKKKTRRRRSAHKQATLTRTGRDIRYTHLLKEWGWRRPQNPNRTRLRPPATVNLEERKETKKRTAQKKRTESRSVSDTYTRVVQHGHFRAYLGATGAALQVQPRSPYRQRRVSPHGVVSRRPARTRNSSRRESTRVRRPPLWSAPTPPQTGARRLPSSVERQQSALTSQRCINKDESTENESAAGRRAS